MTAFSLRQKHDREGGPASFLVASCAFWSAAAIARITRPLLSALFGVPDAESDMAPSSPSSGRGYGIIACTWLEYALSTALLSTAVQT